MIKFLTRCYILTAIGAGFLYAESCYHLNIDIYSELTQLQIVFVVLATLGLYNFIQVLASILQKHKDSFFISHIVLASASLVYCGWFLYSCSFDQNLYIGHLALIGIAYVFPLFGRPLREIPFLKIFLITYVWTAATVVIPIKLNFWNSDVFYEVLLSRMVFVAMVSLAFDITHQESDVAEGLPTFPSVIGNQVKYAAIPLGLMGIYYSISISVQYGVTMAVVDFAVAVLLFQSPSLRTAKLFPLALDFMMLLKFSLLYISAIVLA